MTSQRVQIEGIQDAVDRVASLDDWKILDRAMHKATKFIQRRLAKYPAKPAHSTYRRTGTLGRRWTDKVTNRGREGEVGNNTEYAIYVQGPKRRSFHEAAGWINIEEMAEKVERDVVDIFDDEYKKAAK